MKFKFLAVFFIFCVCCFSIKEPELLVFDGYAMTIDYHIVVKGRNEDRERIKTWISDVFCEINRVYNNWNPDSEIALINRLEAYQTVCLSASLKHFLAKTDEMVRLTQGAFDPSIAPLLALWKKYLEQGLEPPTEELQMILPAVGWEHFHVSDGQLFKDHSLSSLDFGGIAKGYCVDLIVEKLMQEGFQDVLVEWGGEVRAHGSPSKMRPWKVAVTELEEEIQSDAAFEIALEDQALATSGDYIQKWSVPREGKEITYFHIVDPRSKRPLQSKPESVGSATVMAPNCLLADVLAKAAMIQKDLSEAKIWANDMHQQKENVQIWLLSREGGRYQTPPL